MNPPIKARVKFGNVKIECEGDTAFIEGDFLDFAKRVKDRSREMGLISNSSKSSKANRDLSGVRIANETGAKTDSDKILCAVVARQASEGDADYDQVRDDMEKFGALFPKKKMPNFARNFRALETDGKIEKLKNGRYVLSSDSETTYERFLPNN